MLCYWDMTFCPFWKECADGEDCFRRLDEIALWSAGLHNLPIAQFTDKPDCFKEKQDGSSSTKQTDSD